MGPVRGVTNDAPTQVENDSALRESQERFRLLVENAIDDYFLHDEKGNFLDVNERACRNLGYSRDELLTMSAVDVSTDLTQQEKEEIWRRMLPGEAATVDSHHRRRDGSVFPVEVRVSCHLFNGNKVFLGLVRDISDRVKAEDEVRLLNAELEQRIADRTAQLHEITDRLQAVMDSATDAIFLKDREGHFLLFNLAAQHFTGLKSEDVLGKTAVDVFGELAGAKLQKLEQLVMDTGEARTVEETLNMRGTDKVFLANRSPRRDANGRIVGLVGISREITDRKLVERELRTQRERLALATQVSGLGVWDYDIEANTLYCDERWYEIMGRDPNKPTRSIEDFKEWIHPDDANYATDVNLTTLTELLTRRDQYSITFRIVRPDGEIRWIRSAACLVEGGTGLPNRAIGVVADITESHLAEEKLQRSYNALRQAEKLAKIGSWELDLKTSQFSSSEMLCEMNGADPNGPPVTVTDLQRLLPPRSLARVNDALQNCVQTGQSYGLDVEHLRPDGTSFAAHIRGQAILNNEGKVVRLSGTVQDISEREEARAQLTALADNVPSGAIYRFEMASNRDFIFSYFSAGIESLIGIPAEEIVSDRNKFLEAIHEEDLPGYMTRAMHALTLAEVFDHAFRVHRKNGHTLWVHCRHAPRVQSDGRTVWDGIIRDITSEREVAELLSHAKNKAEAAERAKSEFLAAMSHEIRTPMNTVIGMTRLALQTDLSSRQRNYLEKIDGSARNLLGIINDILDFSKIEAGSLQLEETDFTLESVLDTVSTATTLRADEKGLETVYLIAPEVPRTLRGDPLRLSQILINLVGNAVKFTSEGEIVISVDLPPGEPDIPMLRFRVRDTGIGLSANQISALFRPFIQADSGTSRRYGGTGLGLSICKQLVKKMGGAIGVESEPGRGSTFHFTIVLRQVPQTMSHRVSAPALQDRIVLVVDDNATACESLSRMVEMFGMTSHGVSSGKEALEALHVASASGQPYDLVLMDWRMPGMNGIEAARRIREDDVLSHMPAVLMVTAYAREEIAHQVEMLGLQGLLIKPITESMMFNALQHIFSSDHKGDIQEVKSGEIIPRILIGRRILVVDDNLLNQEVAQDFLTIAGAEVDTASSGIQALERLRQQRYDAVLMDVHMPEMDGLQATREIRRNPEWASLPVIALTAQALSEDRAAILQAGMTSYLSKPIDERLLYSTLTEILDGGVIGTQSTQSGPPKDVAGTPFDPTEALKHAGGSRERLHRLLRGFLRDFSDMPERLETALSHHDWTTLRELAHLVKGTAGYLGAESLVRSAADCESACRQENHTGAANCAKSLIEQLKEVLLFIEDELASQPMPIPKYSSKVQTADKHLISALLIEVEPLLMQGDYAAEAVLDKLANLIAGSEEAALLENVRNHFENLELDQAGTVFSQLKSLLVSYGEALS